MKAKIKWYQEVLELEPSSKVFFPLARLFAENDQHAEAVVTLKQGLEKHPEHLEARMLLIESLEKLDARDKLAGEVDTLGGMLSKYPGFWKAWAKALAEAPDTRDAAMAMRFLAAAFGTQDVSWASVIEQGLASVLGDSDLPSVASNIPEPIAQPAPVASTANPTETSLEEAQDVEEISTEPAQEAPLSLAQRDDATPLYVDSVEEDDEEEDGEQFSLRTLSMAEVLATQGDKKGALEICDELESATERGDELAKITEVRETILASTQEPAAEPAQPLESKSKLINTLETLAERLEARAAS